MWDLQHFEVRDKTALIPLKLVLCKRITQCSVYFSHLAENCNGHRVSLLVLVVLALEAKCAMI